MELTDLEKLVITRPSKFSYYHDIGYNPNVTWKVLRLFKNISHWQDINPLENIDLIKYKLALQWKKSKGMKKHNVKWNDLLIINSDVSYGHISGNINITPEIVNLHKGSWTWEKLAANPNFPCESILYKYDITRSKFGLSNLSANSSVTYDIVMKNPNVEWDYKILCSNESLHILEILEMVHTYPAIEWNWAFITERIDVTWDIVNNNPTMPWNWTELSRHPNITWNIIIDNQDLSHFGESAKWNTHKFIRNPNVTLDIIKLHPDWDIQCLVYTEHLSWKIVKYFSHLPWNWFQLSKHNNIKWKHISKNPKFPWDWTSISINPNITWEIIQNNLDLSQFRRVKGNNYVIPQWNMKVFSQNPNITFDIINDHPEIKWDYYAISHNRFKLDTNYIKITKRKKTKYFQRIIDIVLYDSRN